MKQILRLLALTVCLMATVTLRAATADFTGIIIDGYCYSLYNSVNGRAVAMLVKNPDAPYTSVHIPASVVYQNTTYKVTTIGASAFKDNTLITSAVIPGTIEKVNDGAFVGCTNLSRITLKPGATPLKITSAAFVSATNSGTASPLTLDITRKIDTSDIAANATIFGVLNLTQAKFRGNLTTLQTYLVRYCQHLAKVTVEEGITTVESGAFEGCTSLAMLNFPASLTNLGDSNVLASCPDGTVIVLHSATPPQVGDSFLNSANHITAYIPVGSRDKYDYDNSPWTGYSYPSNKQQIWQPYDITFIEGEPAMPVDTYPVEASVTGNGTLQIAGTDDVVSQSNQTIQLVDGVQDIDVMLTADFGSELSSFAVKDVSGVEKLYKITHSAGVTHALISGVEEGLQLNAVFAEIPTYSLTVKMPTENDEDVVLTVPQGQPYVFEYCPAKNQKLTSASLDGEQLYFTVTPEGRARITVPAARTDDAVVNLAVETGIMTAVKSVRDNLNISVRDNCIELSGLTPGETVQIVSVDGILLYQGKAISTTLTTPEMPTGLLLIHTTDHTYRLRL